LIVGRTTGRDVLIDVGSTTGKEVLIVGRTTGREVLIDVGSTTGRDVLIVGRTTGRDVLIDVGRTTGREVLIDVGRTTTGTEVLIDVGRTRTGTEVFIDVGRTTGREVLIEIGSTVAVVLIDEETTDGQTGERSGLSSAVTAGGRPRDGRRSQRLLAPMMVIGMMTVLPLATLTQLKFKVF
jgi:hypothetical protein